MHAGGNFIIKCVLHILHILLGQKEQYVTWSELLNCWVIRGLCK